MGCIFGELLNNSPLFPGENDIEQLCCVLRVLGTPNQKVWPVSSSILSPDVMLSSSCSPDRLLNTCDQLKDECLTLVGDEAWISRITTGDWFKQSETRYNPRTDADRSYMIYESPFHGVYT